LEDSDAHKLRNLFPPRYIAVEKPHCTFSMKVGTYGFPAPATGQVYAKVDDDNGLEALLLAVNEEEFRPDGMRFHITWSLQYDRKPKESNIVIMNRPHIFLQKNIAIQLIPANI